MMQTELLDKRTIAEPPYTDMPDYTREGLPHYWKIPWPYYDQIELECGHLMRVSVDDLENPEREVKCGWIRDGLCSGKKGGAKI